VLVNNQRIYQAQTQRIDLQQNVRAAVNILPAEFRELSASEGDILAMGANSITVRAMRQLAIVCGTPVLGLPAVIFTIRTDQFFSTRDFVVGDNIFVYYEGDQATRNDDSWVPGRITAIANGDCPGGTIGDGRTVTATLAFGTVTTPGGVVLNQFNQTGRIQSGAPIRGWEQVTYRLQQAADANWYIYLIDASGTQPLIGPVLSNGFQMAFFDSAGTATNTPALVASIEITVQGQTLQPIRQGDGQLSRPVDSVQTRVALRNNRRF
jgi:hypothetical protein